MRHNTKCCVLIDLLFKNNYLLVGLLVDNLANVLQDFIVEFVDDR